MSFAVQLSIIVPTFNEHENVPILISKLEAVLPGDDWEIIFVDDNSPDKTAETIRMIAASNPKIRCLQRIDRRGLSGACIEGMLASSAPYIAVMDADCQHDERCVPQMLELLTENKADLVVGSRYIQGGDTGDFTKTRLAGSRLSTFMAKHLLGTPLTDPMSGFFMIKRDSLMPLVHQLSNQGFKILLDLAVTARGKLRVTEIPYVFGTRDFGESKMDSQVVMDFLGLMISKLTDDLVPVRFVFFLLVGGLGLIVHMTIIFLELRLFHNSFTKAHLIAALAAMGFNFFANNSFTYRSQRLRGIKNLTKGLLQAYIVWSIGLLANVAVANLLYQMLPLWWLAALIGATMGSIWNYIMSTIFIWRIR